MRPPNLAFCILFLCFYCIIARKGFVCRTQYMFLLLGYLLNLPASVIRPMISSPLGAPVSRGGPVSVVDFHVGCFIPSLPVFF